MSDHDPGNEDELYAELLERARLLVDLDGAQIEAWTSGLFAALDDDAAALEFIAHVAAQPTPASAAVLGGLAHLADGDVARAAREGADRMASLAPEGVATVGRSRPAQAWRVQARFGSSLVIGFRQDPDVIDHAVLVEIEEDALVDLQLAGPPSELLDPDVLGAGIDVASLEVGEALRETVAAWERAARSGAEVTPGIAANQRLVRRRIAAELDIELPLFVADISPVDTTRGMSVEEIERANTASLGTLLAAVGEPASADTHPAWIEVVRGTVDGLTPRESEGLLWLEWADWLGVGIGLLRSDADHPVVPGSLVDLINRCPEVSSTVHADDRDYAEWAFDVAIEHLVDHGLVENDRLTKIGRTTLHASLVAAWSP